jgi:tetratricopeptide (TPR) repeat protein
MTAAAPGYRAVLALGVGLLVVGVALGAYQSLLSEHRLPAMGLLVDGPADHVEALLVAGDYPGALRQLRRYAGTSSDRLPHERLGQVFRRLGPEARAGVEAALRAEPDYAEGHYQLGLVYAVEENLAPASTHFARFVELRPGNAQVHNSLGILLAKQGRLPEAFEQFRQAVTIDPGYADAVENLGLAAEALHDPGADP